MAISFEQAVSEQVFHYPVPGVLGKCEVWRRNGRTQTWVTKPGWYKVPVKFGLYNYGYIQSAEQVRPGKPSGASVFVRAECPCCLGRKA